MMEVTRYNQLPLNQERRRTTILEYRRSLQLSLRGLSKGDQTKTHVAPSQQNGAFSRSTGIPNYKAPSSLSNGVVAATSNDTQEEIKFTRPSQIPSLKGPSSSTEAPHFPLKSVQHSNLLSSPAKGWRYLSYRQDLSSSLRSVKTGDSSISTTEGMTDPTTRNMRTSENEAPIAIDLHSDGHRAKADHQILANVAQKLEPTKSPVQSQTKTTPQATGASSPRRWASYRNDESVASSSQAKSFRSKSKPWSNSFNMSSSSLAERLKAVDLSPAIVTDATSAPTPDVSPDREETFDFSTTQSISLSGKSLSGVAAFAQDDMSKTQRTSHLHQEITVCSVPSSSSPNSVVPVVPAFMSTRTKNENLMEDESIGDDSLYLAESENRSQNCDLDESSTLSDLEIQPHCLANRLEEIQSQSGENKLLVSSESNSQVESQKPAKQSLDLYCLGGENNPSRTSQVKRSDDFGVASSTSTRKGEISSKQEANASLYEYSAFPDADLNLAPPETQSQMSTQHTPVKPANAHKGNNGMAKSNQTNSGVMAENHSVKESKRSRRLEESTLSTLIQDSADSTLSDDDHGGKDARRISKELMISAELVVKAILRDGKSKVKFTRNACFQALKKYADIQVEVKRLSAKLKEVSAKASQPDIRATAEILKKENKKLKAEVAAIYNRIVTLEQQAQKEKQDYEEMIKCKEKEIFELQHERETQQAEIEILTDRLMEAETAKERVDDREADLSKDVAVDCQSQSALDRLQRMQSRLEKQDLVLHEKETKIKDLENLLASQQSATIVANAPPSSRVEDLRKKRGDREAAFRNQVSRLSSDSVEGNNVSVPENAAVPEHNGDNVIFELRKAQARAQELSIQLEQTRKELQEAEDKLTSLEEEDVLNSVETEALLEERAERIEELEEALTEMATKLFQLEKRSSNVGEGETLRRNAMEGELKAAETRIFSLQQKLVETEERLEAAEELLGSFEREKEKVEELEELANQNHALIQSLREQLAEAQARAEKAEEQASYGNRGHASFGDISFATGGSDTDSSRLLKQALADLDKARQENKSLQEELVSVKSTVNDIREERDFANAKLSEVSGVLLAKRANQVEEHLYEKSLMYAEVSCELSTAKDRLLELEKGYNDKVQECQMKEAIIEDLNRTWDAAASVEDNLVRMRIECDRNLRTAEDVNMKLVESQKQVESLKEQLEFERLQKTNGIESSRSARALHFVGGLREALSGSAHSGFSLRSLYMDHDDTD